MKIGGALTIILLSMLRYSWVLPIIFCILLIFVTGEAVFIHDNPDGILMVAYLGFPLTATTKLMPDSFLGALSNRGQFVIFSGLAMTEYMAMAILLKIAIRELIRTGRPAR